MPASDTQWKQDGSSLIPATPNSRVLSVFTWYTRRLFRKSFHAVRFESESLEVLRNLNDDEFPLLVLMNHSSWWDPLVGVLLANEALPSRSSLAPMDRDQLERFKFMRKLGIFGIDPDDPASETALHRYVCRAFEGMQHPTLWITPQGRFTDVREPMRLRPGAASLASRLDECRVVSIAIEYSFWQDQKPEVFLRAAQCRTEIASTTAWHRAMTAAMQSNASQLAELVISRDPSPFTCIAGGEVARINPLYDLWLRLRGKSGSIRARRSSDSSHQSHRARQQAS